ncbi:hypothetical protein HR060_04585 [Catenovulum sp. SM1970]|uniref:VC2046/SO_2500 family protein n=1 Tax=Marinifaba aquimaris TaxID=2741323 RepID=UPI001572AB8C|nr:VC2046/SO_2500 family protein [Marinifaba aquimaris]NTS76138.1 hypothetical protein [Marinifaba aquimaris]
MKTESLVHELQLDNKLNQSIQQKHRADFSLMLAMLSADAKEFSQFQLPAESLEDSRLDENQLKKELGVHPEVRLDADESYYQIANYFSQSLASGGLAGSKLSIYLYRDTLAEHNDAKKVDEATLANCSSHTQRHIKEGIYRESKEADITQMLEVVESAKAYTA